MTSKRSKVATVVSLTDNSLTCADVVDPLRTPREIVLGVSDCATPEVGAHDFVAIGV